MGTDRETTGPSTPPGPDALPLRAFDAVGAPRAARQLAWMLAALAAALPLALTLVPWQQNVPVTGRVSAIDPLDRLQVERAPVSGRLVEVHVREGSRVRAGDVLAEMEDLDPGFARRLEQQFEFARDELEAAHGNLEELDAQLIQLQDEREFAIQAATSELGVAAEKVRAEGEALVGLRAEREQKRADFERKRRLFERDLRSELEYQEAEAAFQSADAKVRAAEAKIEQARNEELARTAVVRRVGASQQAKIEETRAKRREAEQKLQQVRKKVTEAETAAARQATQTVVATRSGTVQRVLAAGSAGLVSKGAPLFELIPTTERIAVEVWLRGVDAPLVTPGRKVRLAFEGWPAVQVAGWPSVAVGTFGGEVLVTDAQAGADGRVRALVVPDPTEPPWPDRRFLRQGVRTTGWVQLDTVRAGYEIWRQLNAFPPTLREGEPATSPSPGDKGGGA